MTIENKDSIRMFKKHSVIMEDLCTGLTGITIPDTVTSIEYRAFYGCTSLTDIYVNQTESTLLNNASVPDTCTIHWNSTGPESVCSTDPPTS